MMTDPTPAPMRIALFSGNFNMTVDGANKAQNRLVRFLKDRGHIVRIYSPTVPVPAFDPPCPIVSLPSVAIPGRSEYQLPLRFSRRIAEDLGAFGPGIVHISSPDAAARGAVAWALDHRCPAVATVHTRFETYPRYYHLGFLEGRVEAWLRGLYRRCDALLAPSQGMIDVLRAQGMNDDIVLWARGIEADRFAPGQRDLAWRAGLGIPRDAFVVGFLGRLVMEKGLDMVVDTMADLRRRGVAHRVLVIGDGPARAWLEDRLPGAAFTGFQGGAALGRAVAGMDVLLNPSVTETFGNVTLEAMASGVPTVAAIATGSSSLIEDGATGRLVPPGDVTGFADALAAYAADPLLRARHGAAALEASRAYDWDTINGAVEATYRRLIARR